MRRVYILKRKREREMMIPWFVPIMATFLLLCIALFFVLKRMGLRYDKRIEYPKIFKALLSYIVISKRQIILKFSFLYKGRTKVYV